MSQPREFGRAHQRRNRRPLLHPDMPPAQVPKLRALLYFLPLFLQKSLCWIVSEWVPSSVSNAQRSEEHTYELQSLMRISYAVFCLKKKINTKQLILHVKHNKLPSLIYILVLQTNTVIHSPMNDVKHY